MPEIPLKNEYVLNIPLFSKHPAWTTDEEQAIVPVISKNNKPVAVEELTKNGENIFSASFIESMVVRREILVKALGDKLASTVTVYNDKNGTPVVTLFPTGKIDLHNHDWTKLPSEAFDDLTKTIKTYENLLGQNKKPKQSR